MSNNFGLHCVAKNKKPSCDEFTSDITLAEVLNNGNFADGTSISAGNSDLILNSLGTGLSLTISSLTLSQNGSFLLSAGGGAAGTVSGGAGIIGPGGALNLNGGDAGGIGINSGGNVNLEGGDPAGGSKGIVQVTDGNFRITNGLFLIPSGNNAGTATIANGTAAITVATTLVTANSLIFVSPVDNGNAADDALVAQTAAIVAGASFDILVDANVTDGGGKVFNWFFIN